MPRCFMAKKLKYPYEQWKQEQNQQKDSNSRSPSPKDGLYHLEESNNLASEASSESGQHEKITHSKSPILKVIYHNILLILCSSAIMIQSRLHFFIEVYFALLHEVPSGSIGNFIFVFFSYITSISFFKVYRKLL